MNRRAAGVGKAGEDWRDRVTFPKTSKEPEVCTGVLLFLEVFCEFWNS